MRRFAYAFTHSRLTRYPPQSLRRLAEESGPAPYQALYGIFE
jgi:hypothetical protein